METSLVVHFGAVCSSHFITQRVLENGQAAVSLSACSLSLFLFFAISSFWLIFRGLHAVLRGMSAASACDECILYELLVFFFLFHLFLVSFTVTAVIIIVWCDALNGARARCLCPFVLSTNIDLHFCVDAQNAQNAYTQRRQDGIPCIPRVLNGNHRIA